MVIYNAAPFKAHPSAVVCGFRDGGRAKNSNFANKDEGKQRRALFCCQGMRPDSHNICETFKFTTRIVLPIVKYANLTRFFRISFSNEVFGERGGFSHT